LAFLDLHEGIEAIFAEAQERAPNPVEYQGQDRAGKVRRDLEDTWTARSVAYRVEYHREMDELRAGRPRFIVAPVVMPPSPHLNWERCTGLRRWLPEEEESLVEWYLAGVPDEVIAQRLTRQRAAIVNRAAILLEGRGFDRIAIRRLRVAVRRGVDPG